MLDIMGQRGLAQVEDEVVHHLHFLEEQVELVAAVDHEFPDLLAQRAGLAMFQFGDGEV